MTSEKIFKPYHTLKNCLKNIFESFSQKYPFPWEGLNIKNDQPVEVYDLKYEIEKKLNFFRVLCSIGRYLKAKGFSKPQRDQRYSSKTRVSKNVL